MKYLRIISLYISLAIMATGCMGTQVPVQVPKEPRPITLTARNDTDRTHIVYVYDRNMEHTNVFCSEMQPGKTQVFEYINYNHTYDIVWSNSRPDYKRVHWYSFRVKAGQVFFLTTPSRTVSKYGDIHADWESHDNTEHLK
jgi:hypothetical protein